MAREAVQIEGFDAVLKALRASKDVTRKHMVEKIQDGKRELTQLTKQAAPLGETGALRESITEKQGKGLTGYIGIAPGEIRGQRPEVYYRFPEFGTVNITAHPYIRPTANNYADRFINLLRAAGKDIERDMTGGGGLL